MAKKTKEQEAAEAAETERLNAEMMKKMEGVGGVDGLDDLNEVDPFESIPHVTPGKPGFDRIGQVLGGKFLRSKRVVNENSKAAKVDPKTGEKVRFLHVFEDNKGNRFGIWGVGSLDAVMRNILPGDTLAIEYKGVAAEALKPGQNPPHQFGYRGRRADGSKLLIDWDATETPPPAQSAAAGGASARH